MHRDLKLPRRALATGALLLALLAAACGGVDDANEGGSAPDEAGVVIQDGSDASNADAVAHNNGPFGSETGRPSVSDRKITRDATLRLRVEDITGAVTRVEDIAAEFGGFVSSSEVAVSGEDEAEQTASIKIRVPATSYNAVIRELRGMASKVDSESSQATEVTEEYTDLQARLRNLEATEARYIELLAVAKTIDEILPIQDRINSTRLEIEQAQGRLSVLNDITELATITVQLSLLPVSARGGDQGWAEEALSTSWETTQDALTVVGTLAIASAFILPWIVIPGLVFGGAWRVFGRRIVDLVNRLSRI
jgi:hypothetical protein